MTARVADNPTLWLCLTVVVALAFGTWLGLSGVTDPFLYFDVGFVQSLQSESRMSVPENGPFASLEYVPGREMLMLEMAGMLGIEPQTLQFLPLGAVVLAATYYLIAWKLLGSPLVAFLVTSYLTLNLSHAPALYSVFAYAVALPLFLAFLFFALRLTERKAPRELLVLLLLFVALHLIHYTVATWAVVFLAAVNALVWARARLPRPERLPTLSQSAYFALATSVIFVGFNQALYDSFLPLIGPDALDNAVDRFQSYLAFGPEQGRSEYLYSRQARLGIISALPVLLILAPVIGGLLVDGRRIVVERRPDVLADPRAVVATAIVVLGIVDMIAYTVRGSISTKALSLVLPLAALLYLIRSERRWPVYTLAALLLLTSLVKIGLFQASSYVVGGSPAGSSYERAAGSAEWLESHGYRDRYTMLADLNLYGAYLVDSAGGRSEPVVAGYSRARYEWIAGESSAQPGEPPDIVAIDRRSSAPTIGFVFQLFDPLNEHMQAIRANPQLAVVYDDGAVLLGVPLEVRQ